MSWNVISAHQEPYDLTEFTFNGEKSTSTHGFERIGRGAIISEGRKKGRSEKSE